MRMQYRPSDKQHNEDVFRENNTKRTGNLHQQDTVQILWKYEMGKYWHML